MGIFFSSTRKNKKVSPDDGNKNQPSKISDQDRAKLELKRTRDRLRKNQETTRNVIARESKLARELLDKGMKQRAITILKKKKYQETLLERAEKNLLNVEQMMLDIDSAVEMKKVFESLSLGNSCLKALQEEISIDNIDELMQDTAEALQLHEEMSNTLSSNITSQDMTELEDEVMQMMKEMEEEEEAEKKSKQVQKQIEEEESVDLESHLPEVSSKPLPVSDEVKPTASTTKTKKTEAKEVVMA